jgi:hypothetical protein
MTAVARTILQLFQYGHGNDIPDAPGYLVAA